MIILGFEIDWWVLLGLAGQGLFFARFLVQWIISEKRGESVIPAVFWYLSIGGALVILVYAVARRDPVFVLGQGVALIIYSRNLILINRIKNTSTPV